MDPQTGQILATIEPGTSDVHGLAWVAGMMWILDGVAQVLVQVDPAGEVIATHALPDSPWNALAHDGTRFWVSDAQMFYHVELPVQVREGDLDGDGQIGVSDLVALVLAWGACADPPAPCPADIDGDGEVNVNDLVLLVLSWG
jgi:hypothetical protein